MHHLLTYLGDSLYRACAAGFFRSDLSSVPLRFFAPVSSKPIALSDYFLLLLWVSALLVGRDLTGPVAVPVRSSRVLVSLAELEVAALLGALRFLPSLLVSAASASSILATVAVMPRNDWKETNRPPCS